jgi:chemotaxis protein CheX
VSTAAKVQPLNPLLDKKLINAFIEGVCKTLKLMANTDVTVEKPSIEKVSSAKGDVAGMVGMVAGSMKGTLTITYKKEAIFQIIENMLGEKHTDINDTVADCVGEMANQIYGSAKTTLNQMGYAFEMAIPTTVRGTFIISKQHQGATLVIPFSLPNKSQFFVEITVVNG